MNTIDALILSIWIACAGMWIGNGLHAIARAIEKLCEKIDDIE